MRSPQLLILVVVACGPESTSATSVTSANSGGSGTDTATATASSGAGTGSDSQGSATSSTSLTTSSSTTGTSGGTAGTAGTGGACDGLANEYGPVVAVSITNTSDAPVYLQVDGCDMRISVGVVDLATQTPIGKLTDCWTCQDGPAGACICPGPPCYVAAALRLDPGFSWETSIGATEYYQRDYPAQCPASPECGTSCSQAAALSDGDYEVRVVAGTAALCGGVPCDCAPGPEGSCWIEQDGMLQAGNDVGAGFSLPNPTPVVINVP